MVVKNNHSDTLLHVLNNEMSKAELRLFLGIHGNSPQTPEEDQCLAGRALIVALDLAARANRGIESDVLEETLIGGRVGVDCARLVLSRLYLHLPISVIHDEIRAQCLFAHGFDGTDDLIVNICTQLDRYDGGGYLFPNHLLPGEVNPLPSAWLLNISPCVFA